ncbi:MAG TPA: SusE domain-containing protein [Cyclobacteriaceae bacterium]|nr:SusE domain-containing protein [Cyclobacteriaceae bacterium]
MKVIKPIFFHFLLAGALLASCNKEENRVTFAGGTPPVLSVSSASDLVLQKANAAYTSLQFQWSNPNYEFSNGVNTQDVFYTLQIDTTGSNFSSPNEVGLSFTQDVSTTFTVKGLNTALAGMQLSDNVLHPFEFRVKATLGNGSVPVYSNVLKINIATYLDVVYPVPANLYITGSATPKSWMSGGDAPVASQQFTKTNTYTFVLSNFTLIGGQEFLLVPVYGDWSNKYGTVGANDTNNPSGDAFVPAGNNFIAPAATKAYTVTVNFKTGKYTVQ